MLVARTWVSRLSAAGYRSAATVLERLGLSDPVTAFFPEFHA
jgi:hypothetical protein